jgi:general transcriptional corepressor CYC8
MQQFAHPPAQQFYAAYPPLAPAPPQPMQPPPSRELWHQKLLSLNEQSWLQIGHLAETLGQTDRALLCFHHALKHHPHSVVALTRVASIYRAREQFPQAVDILQRLLHHDAQNGEAWASIGHCWLMMDDLGKAYHAYQQALYHLPNPMEPKLWYGVGILYDRYGSLENAEEAFASVIKIDPHFERLSEIYFRLGVIAKQLGKYDRAHHYFRYLQHQPPPPLIEADILFQLGHVHELQGKFEEARDVYERILTAHPTHAKVLQQLAWLYCQWASTAGGSTGGNDAGADYARATALLQRAIEADPNDPQTYYLQGRAYMLQQDYTKAYESYQQAVYRDGTNPVFWCSIGVLYYQIGQYRDSLDAYTRAIRLNPQFGEVWHNLGTLYESCNNQIQDALDAYTKASELDVSNTQLRDRLAYLKQLLASGDGNPDGAIPPPAPLDINPNTYKFTPPATQKAPSAVSMNMPALGKVPLPEGTAGVPTKDEASVDHDIAGDRKRGATPSSGGYDKAVIGADEDHGKKRVKIASDEEGGGGGNTA